MDLELFLFVSIGFINKRKSARSIFDSFMSERPTDTLHQNYKYSFPVIWFILPNSGLL